MLVIAALAVTVGIGILRGAIGARREVVVDDDGGDRMPRRRRELYVHVSGAVRGARALRAATTGARVVDAIAAAGGFAEDADESAVNLARPLERRRAAARAALGRGDRRRRRRREPRRRRARQPQHGRRRRSSTRCRASARRWPQRIIDWRDANGRFTSVEDLLAVPGIGDKMLESLRDLVTV